MADRKASIASSLAAAREAVRTQLWPLPCLGIAVALIAGVALPRGDATIRSGLPHWLVGLLFGGSPSAARTVLDAIASSLITVTALTFSLTVVTLQLASSQFSPRLLRTFTGDGFVQVTLALFLATFTYALTVLRTVRDSSDTQAPFVPSVSITVCFLLTVASMIALVLFLAHLARQIRVETMLRAVHTSTSATISRLLNDPDVDKEHSCALPPPAEMPSLISAAASGFLVRVDEEDLLTAAIATDAIIMIDLLPGESAIAGVPFGTAWSRHGGPLSPVHERQLVDRVQRAVFFGYERNGFQDVSFGLRQLTDVAVKALSPGINDPTTAIHALSHSSALLCEIATHTLGPRILRDKHDNVRVSLARPHLAELLDLAVTQPRRYGATDPLVMARLMSLLREIAWCTSASERPIVASQLARLRATIANSNFDSAERNQLAELGRRVDHALTGQWQELN